MSDPSTSPDSATPAPNAGSEYQVVARRYRPQSFGQLVGQEHVASALTSAIESGRVGHAYLFTGARGVGKTSSARILAKALNCKQGTSAEPCHDCDICQSIASGDDVDVLEIDGASNRGIDEIRQLRQNANVRPSRSRYKIYIIDEVHMLTREAFNALLKTLEEPPEHVKFIFCTTEPTKIPITILSRCQRFDFAGIHAGSIAERLKQIAELEGVEADDEALRLLARRAAGSMRDGQSLLEQLLSITSARITVAQVHDMLGTADDHRLSSLVEHLLDRDMAAILTDLDSSLEAGLDLALILEQLFGYLRDCMVALAGCPEETFLYAPAGSEQKVGETGDRLGLNTILAAMQILDQTLARMRVSTQGRVLAELALVRICQLEELQSIPELLAQLQGDAGPAPARAARPAATTPKKKPEAPPVRPPQATSAPETPSIPPPSSGSRNDAPPTASKEPETISPVSQVALTAENAAQVWRRALSTMSGMGPGYAKDFDRVAISAPNCLVVTFKPGYTLAKSFCETPEQLVKFEKAMLDQTGSRVRIQFDLAQSKPEESKRTVEPAKVANQHERLMEVTKHPLVERAGELFGAEPTGVIPPPEK